MMRVTMMRLRIIRVMSRANRLPYKLAPVWIGHRRSSGFRGKTHGTCCKESSKCFDLSTLLIELFSHIFVLLLTRLQLLLQFLVLLFQFLDLLSQLCDGLVLSFNLLVQILVLVTGNHLIFPLTLLCDSWSHILLGLT